MRLGDLQAVIEIESHPDHRKFMGGYDDPERTKRSLQKAIDELEARGYGLLGITLMPDPASPIMGYCGLLPSEIDRKEVELVCAIGERHSRQGFGYESCERVIRWAFECLDRDRIVGRCEVTNTKSRGLVRRLGMRPCGTRRDILTGRMETVYVIERSSTECSM